MFFIIPTPVDVLEIIAFVSSECSAIQGNNGSPCVQNNSVGLSNFGSVIGCYRLVDLFKTFIMARFQLQIANQNLTTAAAKFSYLGLEQFRGHMFEVLHESTFNINAVIHGSELRAIQTSRIPGLSNHIVDILVTPVKNLGMDIRSLLLISSKEFIVQLKAGISSSKTITNKKYIDMTRVSEMASKCSSQVMKVGEVSSDVVKTNKLTAVSKSLRSGKNVSVMNKGKLAFRCFKAAFSKALFVLSVAESTIRNGQKVYKGEISIKNGVKEVVFDLLFINTAKDLYALCTSNKAETSNTLYIEIGAPRRSKTETTSICDSSRQGRNNSMSLRYLSSVERATDIDQFIRFDNNPFIQTEKINIEASRLSGSIFDLKFRFFEGYSTQSDFAFLDRKVDMRLSNRNLRLFIMEDHSVNTNNMLNSIFLDGGIDMRLFSPKFPILKENFEYINIKNIFGEVKNPSGKDLTEMSSSEIVSNILRSAKEERQKLQLNDKGKVDIGRSAKEGRQKSRLNDKGKVDIGRSAGSIAQQGVTAFGVSIADKLARNQPLNWKDHAEAFASSCIVTTGTIIGANSSCFSAGVGGAVGAGIITLGLEAVTMMCKKGIKNLDREDYAVFTGKSVITAGSVYISGKVLSTTSAASAGIGGAAIGFVTNVLFASWACYKTRNLSDYDMNKWTWCSVASSGVKGAVSSGVSLAVVAALNCWNPAGWALIAVGLAGAATAMVTHYGTTYIEEKCSDQWGQRKKHMDHCCTVLGCGDNISKEQFVKVMRDNRAKFHPDKTQSETEKELSDIQECIDAYCILRKWDPEDMFTNKDKISKSWSRNLFKRFYKDLEHRFNSLWMLKAYDEMKKYDYFVIHLRLYDEDDEIPENAYIIPGGEDMDKEAKAKGLKRIRVIYASKEYKNYALTSFTVHMSSKQKIINVSQFSSKEEDPVRIILITRHNPSKTKAKIICKISSEEWLVGLTDNSEETLKEISEGESDSLLDDIEC